MKDEVSKKNKELEEAEIKKNNLKMNIDYYNNQINSINTMSQTILEDSLKRIKYQEQKPDIHRGYSKKLDK